MNDFDLKSIPAELGIYVMYYGEGRSKGVSYIGQVENYENASNST